MSITVRFHFANDIPLMHQWFVDGPGSDLYLLTHELATRVRPE